MWEIQSLDGDAHRDAIDARDRFLELRIAERELAGRYDGAMFYEARGDREYLLRRHSGSMSKKSLGARSAETDAMLAEFKTGQERLTGRIKGLRSELERVAPVLAARGLGRVPRIAARVLRRIDRAGWLGTRLHVIGTNALFAYEALAGVRIRADATATGDGDGDGDGDLLGDSRQGMSLGGENVSQQGSVGLLRKVDKSFGARRLHVFRAVNDQGYMVDLVTPVCDPRANQRAPRSSNSPEDLEAVEIEGLAWLVKRPQERGCRL